MAKSEDPVDRLNELKAKLSFVATAFTIGNEPIDLGGDAKEGLIFLLYDFSEEAGRISEMLSNDARPESEA